MDPDLVFSSWRRILNKLLEVTGLCQQRRHRVSQGARGARAAGRPLHPCSSSPPCPPHCTSATLAIGLPPQECCPVQSSTTGHTAVPFPSSGPSQWPQQAPIWLLSFRAPITIMFSLCRQAPGSRTPRSDLYTCNLSWSTFVS